MHSTPLLCSFLQGNKHIWYCNACKCCIRACTESLPLIRSPEWWWWWVPWRQRQCCSSAPPFHAGSFSRLIQMLLLSLLSPIVHRKHILLPLLEPAPFPPTTTSTLLPPLQASLYSLITDRVSCLLSMHLNSSIRKWQGYLCHCCFQFITWCPHPPVKLCFVPPIPYSLSVCDCFHGDSILKWCGLWDGRRGDQYPALKNQVVRPFCLITIIIFHMNLIWLWFFWKSDLHISTWFIKKII